MAGSLRAALLGVLAVRLAFANPNKVACNLAGTNGAPNVFTSSANIMGSAPVDVAIGSPSPTTYTAGSTITWSVDSSKFIAGFIKATAGTISSLGHSTNDPATQRTDCTGADAGADAWYTAQNSNAGGGIGTLPPFTWTAPSDACVLPSSVQFYFIGNTATNKQAVNRHTITVSGPAASGAAVTSTATTTIEAGTATVLNFVTAGLLSAAGDKAFVKVVSSTTTCDAVGGISDALSGGVCELAQSGGATLGTCTITIAASVSPSTQNRWCYSASSTSGCAYVPLTSGTLTDTTAPASRASVTSTTTTTLQAGVAATVAFVTVDLLTAAYDKAFIKIVPSSTTCDAQDGVSDSVLGGACVLAQSSSATAGTCSITITASVTASNGNIWCYTAGPDNSGAYLPLTTNTFTDTTNAPAGASLAVVVSTLTLTLQAGVTTTVNFVTSDLLTAVKDKAFLKIVPSGTTCEAANGVGDAIVGGTCELVQSGGASAGTCSITITSSVAASASNKWCYSAAADSSSAYVALASGTLTAVTAAASRASVVSTTTATLAAGNQVEVEWVTTGLLSAAFDRAFIKLVPAGGGGCATSGVGDAVSGAVCELALKTAGVATAGVCAMTIDPSVAASTVNEWCFRAGSSSAGLYQSTTTPSFAATTAQLMWSSPDGSIDVWWSFPATGKTFFTIKCKKVTGADGWCAFGLAPTAPVTMNAISSAVWDLADGSLKEYDLTAQSDPVTGGMLASVAGIESSNLNPGTKVRLFTVTVCANPANDFDLPPSYINI